MNRFKKYETLENKNLPIWVLIDGIEKQIFISNSNVNRVRIYGKLWLKAWHKAIKTILEYNRVAHQLKKNGVELSFPAQDVQCRAIVFDWQSG